MSDQYPGFNAVLVTICVVITVITYLAGRLGLVNKYTAGILGAALENPLLGFAMYLAAGMGAVALEMQDISSDFQYSYIAADPAVQSPIPNRANLTKIYMLARFVMYLGGFLIAYKIPSAPFQIPWYVNIPILLTLAWVVENGESPNRSSFEAVTRVGGTGLLLAFVNRLITQVTGGDFNPAVATILGLAIASGFRARPQNSGARHKSSNFDPEENAFDPGLAGIWWSCWSWFIVWCSPGLSVATASRCIGAQQTQIAYGHQEAFLEGWSVGAILLWGTMTGKTMLGELMQNWVTTKPSDLNNPAAAACIGIAVCIGAVMLHILFVNPEKPLPVPTQRQKRLAAACCSVGMLIQGMILLGGVAFIYALIGLAITVVIPDQENRPLLLLFLAI
jgi:hypothetical protein